jgi:hypothetical protein
MVSLRSNDQNAAGPTEHGASTESCPLGYLRTLTGRLLYAEAVEKSATSEEADSVRLT